MLGLAQTFDFERLTSRKNDVTLCRAMLPFAAAKGQEKGNENCVVSGNELRNWLPLADA
jgi:hypothetical protein